MFVSLDFTTNAEGYKTHFSYDERHNLIAVSGPHEDYYKEIHYDRVNRPIEEKVSEKNGSFLLTKKRYNTLHQLISTTDESGFETHFAYNVLGQVKEIIHPDGGVEKKEYDPLGNLIQEIDPRGNVTLRTYNFRGSPTSILYPDGTSEHFTYNPNGTLKTHRDKQGAETRTGYDLFDHPLKEEVYSPEGTLLHTKSATWSAFNKLSETDEEGITTYFTYDYAGQKTSECKENLTIKYHYDSLGRLTQIQKPQTTHLKEFDHLNRLIEQRTEDKEGALTFKENYLYFGRRYYSPSLGRWISPDPQGFEDGPNLYAYVHNTPLLAIDLYGEYAYYDQAKYYGGQFGRAAIDFAFPCSKALYNLPPDASMWKRGAYAFGAVGEAALLFLPVAKVGVSLAEKTAFQIGKAALARNSERAMLRTASKTSAFALENKALTQSLARNNQTFSGSASQLAYTPKANVAKTLDLDALSKAGQVMDREGLTKAGRALDKHGNRLGSPFPKATGNPTSKNIQGQFHLDDILTDPSSKYINMKNGSIRIYSPDGRGVHFSLDGGLKGFLDY